MKIIALVTDEERAFLITKTDKIQFCDNLSALNMEIKDKRNKDAQFVLSGKLTYFLDDFKNLVHDNKDITFVFYTEKNDFIEPFSRHIKTENFCEEPADHKDLIGIINDKIILKIAKSGLMKGSIVLKKLK